MNFPTVVLFASTVIFCTAYVDATICKPLSKFKVDCDECQCSEDGTEYSCTVRNCQPSSFLNADKDSGYVITNPRKRIRDADEAVPYINDEIPPSREETGNEFSDDSDYYDETDNKNEESESEEQFQDVSLNEQDSSVMDTGLPDDYRLRRFIRPGRFIKPGK